MENISHARGIKYFLININIDSVKIWSVNLNLNYLPQKFLFPFSTCLSAGQIS